MAADLRLGIRWAGGYPYFVRASANDEEVLLLDPRRYMFDDNGEMDDPNKITATNFGDGDNSERRKLISSIGGSVRRVSIVVAIASVVLYLSACGLLYFKQRSLLYFPTAESQQPDAVSVSLKSGGETIKIWTRTGASPDAVIYFGGNSEDVGFTLSSIAKSLPGKDLYFVNYRGYGGSTGSPTESGLFTDSLAVYDLVQKGHANIAVVGRSMGTGVAVYLASVRKVDKLVLVTPYDSIENVAKHQFPYFPISLLLKDKFDSTSRVKDVSAKSLLIIAEKDEVIPRQNSDTLTAQFPAGQATVQIINGATHNSIGFSREYSELLASFLK